MSCCYAIVVNDASTPRDPYLITNCLHSLGKLTLLTRAGANSGPELDLLANSNSNSGIGIGIELAFPSLIGIGIEFELPVFELELNLNSHNLNWNWSQNCVLRNWIRNCFPWN